MFEQSEGFWWLGEGRWQEFTCEIPAQGLKITLPSLEWGVGRAKDSQDNTTWVIEHCIIDAPQITYQPMPEQEDLLPQTATQDSPATPTLSIAWPTLLIEKLSINDATLELRSNGESPHIKIDEVTLNLDNLGRGNDGQFQLAMKSGERVQGFDATVDGILKISESGTAFALSHDWQMAIDAIAIDTRQPEHWLARGSQLTAWAETEEWIGHFDWALFKTGTPVDRAQFSTGTLILSGEGLDGERQASLFSEFDLEAINPLLRNQPVFKGRELAGWLNLDIDTEIRSGQRAEWKIDVSSVGDLAGGTLRAEIKPGTFAAGFISKGWLDLTSPTLHLEKTHLRLAEIGLGGVTVNIEEGLKVKQTEHGKLVVHAPPGARDWGTLSLEYQRPENPDVSLLLQSLPSPWVERLDKANVQTRLSRREDAAWQATAQTSLEANRLLGTETAPLQLTQSFEIETQDWNEFLINQYDAKLDAQALGQLHWQSNAGRWNLHTGKGTIGNASLTFNAQHRTELAVLKLVDPLDFMAGKSQTALLNLLEIQLQTPGLTVDDLRQLGLAAKKYWPEQTAIPSLDETLAAWETQKAVRLGADGLAYLTPQNEFGWKSLALTLEDDRDLFVRLESNHGRFLPPAGFEGTHTLRIRELAALARLPLSLPRSPLLAQVSGELSGASFVHWEAERTKTITGELEARDLTFTNGWGEPITLSPKFDLSLEFPLESRQVDVKQGILEIQQPNHTLATLDVSGAWPLDATAGKGELHLQAEDLDLAPWIAWARVMPSGESPLQLLVGGEEWIKRSPEGKIDLRGEWRCVQPALNISQRDAQHEALATVMTMLSEHFQATVGQTNIANNSVPQTSEE